MWAREHMGELWTVHVVLGACHTGPHCRCVVPRRDAVPRNAARTSEYVPRGAKPDRHKQMVSLKSQTTCTMACSHLTQTPDAHNFEVLRRTRTCIMWKKSVFIVVQQAHKVQQLHIIPRNHTQYLERYTANHVDRISIQ